MVPRMATKDDALAARLRETGLKVTPGRLAVLHLLGRSASSKTHAEVVEALGGQPDRASVFRNLNDLVRAGLLARHDAGDGVFRFSSNEEAAEHRAHPHFLCDDCGELRCLPDVEVVVRSRGSAPRAVREARVDVRLRGRCDRCADGDGRRGEGCQPDHAHHR
jgi:Fur family ferric uptake transcriptional regulator